MGLRNLTINIEKYHKISSLIFKFFQNSQIWIYSRYLGFLVSSSSLSKQVLVCVHCSGMHFQSNSTLVRNFQKFCGTDVLAYFVGKMIENQNFVVQLLSTFIFWQIAQYLPVPKRLYCNDENSTQAPAHHLVQIFTCYFGSQPNTQLTSFLSCNQKPHLATSTELLITLYPVIIAVCTRIPLLQVCTVLGFNNTLMIPNSSHLFLNSLPQVKVFTI